MPESEISPEMWLERIKQDWTQIAEVPEQTDEMCRAAIAQDAFAIAHIKNQTPELCRLAIAKKWSMMIHIREESLTDDLCYFASSVSPYAVNCMRLEKEKIPTVCFDYEAAAAKLASEYYKCTGMPLFNYTE